MHGLHDMEKIFLFRKSTVYADNDIVSGINMMVKYFLYMD